MTPTNDQVETKVTQQEQQGIRVRTKWYKLVLVLQRLTYFVGKEYLCTSTSVLHAL